MLFCLAQSNLTWYNTSKMYTQHAASSVLLTDILFVQLIICLSLQRPTW